LFGKSVKLVDSGTPAARLVEDYLNGRGLRNQSVHHGQSEFYVSDVPTKFREIAEIFLGKKLLIFIRLSWKNLRTSDSGC